MGRYTNGEEDGAALPTKSYLDTSDSPIFLFQGDGDATDDGGLAPDLQAGSGTLKYRPDIFVEGSECFFLDGSSHLELSTTAYDTTLRNVGDKVISVLGLFMQNGPIVAVAANLDRYWQLFIDTSGNFGCGWHSAGNAWQSQVTSGVDYRGRLCHFVVQIVSNDISLWVNRTKLVTSSGLAAPGANSNAKLYIGTVEDLVQKQLGLIASIKLLHGTKSDADVEALFDQSGYTS